MKTYEQQHYEGETGRQRALREAGDCHQAFAVTAGLITEELGYVFDLEQYPGQELGRGTDDPDRIQPVDLSLPNQWRYNTDKLLEDAPIHISCKPTQRLNVDPMLVAEKCAQMRRALEHQLLYNPVYSFEDVRERYVGGAQAGRMWSARWDFVPELGEKGEIVARLVDPRNLMIPRGYLTPHDPLCPALFDIVRMPINEARRKKNWKHTAELEADSGDFNIGSVFANGGRDTSEVNWQSGQNRGSDSTSSGSGWVTLLMVWRRFEKTEGKDLRVEIEPEMRRMTCSACKYQTPPEGALRQVALEIGAPFEGLPELQEGCPQCELGVLKRQDFREKTPLEISLEKGKRLEIYCLNGSVTEELYRGPWPCPGARTFPYLWLGAYLFPHRAIAESNVSWGWPISAARNFTRRVAFEQVHRSRPFTVLPWEGLEDRNGQPFDLGEDSDDVAWATKDFPPEHLQIVQAQPVNEALFELEDRLGNEFRVTQGNDQISISPERTRDIAASSLALQQDSGNVPLNGMKRRLYAAEAIWFGVLSDYIRHFWRVDREIGTPDQLGATPGGMVWEQVYGPELPNVDVVVGAGPDLSQLRQETMTAYRDLAGLPRPLRRAMGMAAGIDKYTLDMMDEIEMQLTPVDNSNVSSGAPAAARPANSQPSQRAMPPNGRPMNQQPSPPARNQ